MKKSIVTIAILITGLVAGPVLFTSCGSKQSEQHEHDQGEEHEHHDMDSPATVYACPMHPEVTGKEGDTCSKCGMKLEPVKNNDSTEMHDDH